MTWWMNEEKWPLSWGYQLRLLANKHIHPSIHPSIPPSVIPIGKSPKVPRNDQNKPQNLGGGRGKEGGSPPTTFIDWNNAQYMHWQLSLPKETGGFCCSCWGLLLAHKIWPTDFNSDHTNECKISSPENYYWGCGDTVTNVLEYFGGHGHLYVKKLKKKRKKKEKKRA